MKSYYSVLIVTVLLVLSSTSVDGAWGDYDTTFGFLGAMVDTNAAYHKPHGIALQTDGKILVTGYRLVGGKKRFFLRRYLSNGQVDTSFGNNGSAITTAFINARADYYGQKIVVQDNGRIVVSGMGGYVPVVWRFFSNGTADTSIGLGGMKSLPAYESYPPSIATYANILYVGVAEEGTPSTVILKFDTTGAQDMSFGTSGEAQTGADGRGFSMSIEPSTGNILIGSRGLNTSNIGVQRVLPTGAIDGSFISFGAPYTGYTGAYPNQFVRASNGTFVLNQKWLNLGSALLLAGDLLHLSFNGANAGLTQYEPSELLTSGPNGSCPDVFALQQNGRLVAKGMNNDEIFRFSTNYLTVTTMSCTAYANLDYPLSPAVLQTDDKMLAAGVYSDYLTIVRTIP